MNLSFDGFAAFGDLPVFLTVAEFQALPEYSCTLPSGTIQGKTWRRIVPYVRSGVGARWFLGRYGRPVTVHEGGRDQQHITIEWAQILICDDYSVRREA